jgi:hypothetical protein
LAGGGDVFQRVGPLADVVGVMFVANEGEHLDL